LKLSEFFTSLLLCLTHWGRYAAGAATWRTVVNKRWSSPPHVHCCDVSTMQYAMHLSGQWMRSTSV